MRASMFVTLHLWACETCAFYEYLSRLLRQEKGWGFKHYTSWWDPHLYMSNIFHTFIHTILWVCECVSVIFWDVQTGKSFAVKQIELLCLFSSVKNKIHPIQCTDHECEKVIKVHVAVGQIVELTWRELVIKSAPRFENWVWKSVV